MKNRTKPIPVNFRTDASCIEAAVLAMMGCSTKLIMKRTGFTACQTTYRLKKADIRRADFRNGENKAFEIVYNRARGQIINQIAQTIGVRG